MVMDTSIRPKINLSIDVEDVLGDQFLLNSLLYDLIDFCIKHCIPLDIYVSGIKYDLLKRNPCYQDIFSYEKFINIGYHSNTHSYVTIPELHEENLIRTFEEHNFDFYRNQITDESGGIENFIGKSDMFRCPGLCWTPLYFNYMSKKQFNYTSIDINYDGILQYNNLTILPVLEKPLESFSDYSELKTALQGKSIVSLYFHPARLLYDNFWDKMKENKRGVIRERNIYPDSAQRILKLKKVLLNLKNNYELFSIKQIKVQKKLYPPNTNLVQLFMKSMTSKFLWSQIVKPINSEYYKKLIIESEQSLSECLYTII